MDQQTEDQRWMAAAMRLAAQAAENGEVPVGAIVVVRGEVVGKGFNRPISGCDPTAHAEIEAIRDAAARLGNYRLVDAKLYVTLEPCTMCAGAMVHARIGELVFGATEPKAGVAVSRAQFFAHSWLNHRVQVRGGVLAEQCSEQLSAFFRARRAQKRNERLQN